ncbi:MAG: FkbM family methyltransferase, partial [Chloroflexi bacterium]|nr:FkbM family methyltransferase [Chloroflexota bacterium]
EPDSWLVGLLRRSARLRPDHRAKVQVITAAAAESLGVRRFFVAERGRSANYIEGAGTAESGGVREEQLVVTLTLDWLLTAFPAPRIVKIDVEGMEPRVLQGAAHMLQSVRPTILCEVMESNREEVTKLLRSAGYTLYNMEHDKGARHAQEHAAFNTLACPPA